MSLSPVIGNKHYTQPSVFTPASLLRAARRQKGIPAGPVPDFCVLDPDGDLSHQLRAGGARRNPHWACYHTEMLDLKLPTNMVGVIGGAVGSAFAVLVAEELFASGCRFLMSVTSAGQIVPAGQPPYFVLIDRALRDEGASYHYQPPSPYARIEEAALAIGLGATDGTKMVRGGVWTTDAPFRETEAAIAFARAENLLAVEMEAAALYAFATATGNPVICFARVTNQLGMIENDFEKGEADGNPALVEPITRAEQYWRNQP